MKTSSRVDKLIPIEDMFALFLEDAATAVYRSEQVRMIGLTEDGGVVHYILDKDDGLVICDDMESLQGFSSHEMSPQEVLPDGKAPEQVLTPEQIKEAAEKAAQNPPEEDNSIPTQESDPHPADASDASDEDMDVDGYDASADAAKSARKGSQRDGVEL